MLNGTQLRSEWAPCLLMGAEWVAIAIRMSLMCIPMGAEAETSQKLQQESQQNIHNSTGQGYRRGTV